MKKKSENILKTDWSEHDAKLVVNIKTLDHILMSSHWQQLNQMLN